MGPLLTFLGATGTVTGSKFLVSGSQGDLMVDCGLYQGEKRWRELNWRQLEVAPSTIRDVVLTHAHLDHCGYLPALVRAGFDGPVWATESTAALAAIVLRDSAHLQEEDAAWARSTGTSRHDPPLPLYTAADAEDALRLLHPVGFETPISTRSGARISLTRAGHVLGSSSALVAVEGARVLFSGDLGRPAHPLLLPRSHPPSADVVVVESTYGDRRHPPVDNCHEVLASAIRRTIGRGGSVLVPAFAVDRTELVLLTIARLMAGGAIPSVPVYVDSPMALAALDVYARPAAVPELQAGGLREVMGMPQLRTARTADESRRLNTPGAPCIIISASGMATGGRVVHHLRHLLPNPHHCVVLTGYQAVGTRGRALADGAHEVRIAGRYVRVRAEVVTDEAFSVHADADELLAWLHELPEVPATVYVVHGEDEARRALADRVREELDCAVAVPRLGERVRLD